jgi:hypothetical protein
MMENCMDVAYENKEGNTNDLLQNFKAYNQRKAGDYAMEIPAH